MRHSLTQLALAAVARRVEADPATAPEAAFLAAQVRDLPAGLEAFAEAVRQALRRPVPEDEALALLGTRWQLSLAEVLSLALVAAVERDLMVGRAIAFAQAPVGGSRPTLGLLATAFGQLDGPKRITPLRLSAGRVFEGGALSLSTEGGPIPERPVSVPPALCIALGGEEASWPGAVCGAEDGGIPIAASVLEACRRHAEAIGRSPQSPVLVIRSAFHEEARAAACAIACALKRSACFLEPVFAPGLAGWLLLRDFLPVFVMDPGPGEVKQVPSIPLYEGPLLVVAGVDGSLAAAVREVVNWPMPVPTPEERLTLWRQALPDLAEAAELARSHRLSAARVAQLGKLASHRARLDGQPQTTAATVREVSRSGEGVGLESLAQLIPDRVPDDALVLSVEARAELEGLLARCRERDGLTAGLGVSARTRYTPGVRALLVGPSGTGKTLAACWLATRLELPLFRVDLASLTSKYIGETEKNLARLLARAERTEAVLLFDEADSLFGKRTDVRESNDRFANAQTNYLLQRIETFDGIALLTSNSRSRLDTGFSRRLDVIIELPAPAPPERRALWLAHLGDAHSISPQELNLLAGQCDFAGGQIRNVVLAAAVEARQNGRVIDFDKLLRALSAECRKAGRPVPPALLAARNTTGRTET
jgi:hypothetical protein